MIQKLSRFLTLVAGFVFLFVSSLVAGEMVVIFSSAPDITAGAIIDGAKTLTLAEGQEVTLVSKNGASVTFSGPYAEAPEAGKAPGKGDDEGLLKDLAKLLKDDKAMSFSSLGATRALPSPSPDTPWEINVFTDGDYCVKDASTVSLWRAWDGDESTLTLKNLKNGKQVDVTWPADSRTLGWPKDLAITGGATYAVHRQGGEETSKITLHVLPKKLKTPSRRAIWMADRGCDGQARMVLLSIR